MSKDKDEFIIDVPRKKKKHILDELLDIESLNNGPSLSVINKYKNQKSEDNEKKKKKKDAKNAYITDDDSIPDWLVDAMSCSKPKKKKKKAHFTGFEVDENGEMIIEDKKKKKKKKNKKKAGLTNYHKEFESESSMLRSMYVDQSKFADDLQKKYNAMNNTKATARGIGKFTTDLINSITSARSTQLAIVDKQINLKKTMADLTMKEKKEFGSKTQDNSDNAAYASTFMNELIKAGRGNFVDNDYSSESAEEVDFADDELMSTLSESLDNDAQSYIDYENQNITVYCIVDDNGNAKYEARDGDGEVVPGYPLPNMSKMSFNRSTMTATDFYGRKYPLEIVDSVN